MKNLKSPVFIIGCPRSGTSIFMEILGFHPSFSWPSQYMNKYPSCLELAVISRIYDIPIMGNFLKKKCKKLRLPRPYEAWNFYRFIDPGFYPYPRSSAEVQDELRPPPEKFKERFKRAVGLIQDFQGKQRFIAKYTNKPRIKYINSIFEDAVFIHVLRDARAVVNSLYNKVRNRDWIKKDERRQWIECFPFQWKEDIMSSNWPDIVFLSYYYRNIISRIFEQLNTLSPERRITVRYKDFTTEPENIFKEVCMSLKISWTEKYKSYVLSKEIKNLNYKWKKNLSGEQINVIEHTLNDFYEYWKMK